MGAHSDNSTGPSSTGHAGGEAGGAAALGPHLVPLGRDWAAWRWCGLRSAGFPVDGVLRFAAAECAEAADRCLRAEEEVGGARSAALGALERAMEGADSETHPALEKARRRVQKHKAPPSVGLPGPALAAVETFRAAVVRLEEGRLAYAEAYAVAAARTSRAVNETSRDEKFREAVLWQNRHALHHGLDVLLRPSAERAARGSKRRQHEELVANYLQRYCVKNDTIGFFGPVGWAKLTSEGEALVARAGPGLLAARNVYFEGWCVDELASALARDKSLRPWLSPLLPPFVRVEADTLHTPFGPPSPLPPEYAALLRACDGRQTAREIAAALSGHAADDAADGAAAAGEQEVFRMLEQAESQGLLSWTLAVPFEQNPERSLRRLLERVGDEGLRAAKLASLDRLEAARDAVAAAAGNVVALDEALGKLEAVFTSLTGSPPTREGGKVYAARTLVYEDSRRDLEVEVGPELLASIGAPLSLLLTSARWLTFEAAAGFEKVFREVYRRLLERTGSGVVDCTHFWHEVQPVLFDDPANTVFEVASAFQKRWADILNLPAGGRRVQYDSDDLRARVAESFKAPRPGWDFARYHSPDILVAAPDAEAVRRGDYELVLGEIHVGTNTLSNSLFLEQHPSVAELFESLELDLPAPRLVPVPPRDWPAMTVRMLPLLISPKDFRIIVAPEAHDVPAAKALPIGALVVVENVDGELVVRTRDGRVSFSVIETFADILTSLVINGFRMFRYGGHTPRVTFDRLVVSRESWSFPASELQFAFESDDAARFMAARRWAKAQGLPRFTFAKVAVERKPFYVDFDSPVYVDIFAKMVRRTFRSGPEGSWVNLSEMIPDGAQAWVPDAEGRRYASEFRMVALDLMTKT